jgi:predicted GNAT family N-acyltransferase
MAFTVRPIADDVERDACYAVRMTVFVEEQQVPPWEELDADDETAQHFLIADADTIIGTARLLDKGDGVGKIGRVAVLKEYRGKQAGRQLMEHVISFGEPTYDVLILDAQVAVIPFYERLGFVAEGDIFLDAAIEHRRMTRRSGTP